jgi:hypothetical protein
MATMTAAQICNLARQIAKVPGFTVQSGQQLNLCLQNLAQVRDVRVNLVLEQINVGTGTNGPFTGATDYNRTYDMFFQQQGLTYFLDPVELSYYDAQFKNPQLANYPYMFSVDSSPLALQLPQQFYIYPMTNQALILQHRYFRQQADITTPETSTTVPWFPDSDYLVHETATRLMKIADDDRLVTFVQLGEEMLRKWLVLGDGDRNNIAAKVKLDPQSWKRTRSLRPTKVTG